MLMTKFFIALFYFVVVICSADAREAPKGHPLRVAIEGPSDLGHLDTYLTLEQWFCNYTAKPSGGRPPYRYEWTASDGGTYSGQTARYYPTTSGKNWVKVKVTDRDDNTVTETKDIFVHDRIEILSATSSKVDQGPEFLIAENENDTDQTHPWVATLEAEASVTVGLTVNGGLDLNRVAAKIGAAYSSTRTVTHTQTVEVSLSLEPGQTGFLHGTRGTNVVEGQAKQWNTCSEGETGVYRKREPPYIKTRTSTN
jgi:hypothetical protein